MNKAQAVDSFMRCNVRPHLAVRVNEGRQIDTGMLDEAWDYYTDSLCKNGDITTHQYNTWARPKWPRNPLSR